MGLLLLLLVGNQKYEGGLVSSGMMVILNFVKLSQMVQNLKGDVYTEWHDMIS
jgi:hypothetical protein